VADKRQEETKDTLGSIFDFIFAQAEKPVEKRRPIKYSNVDGGSEMVDALISVLEKPGLYVSDQIMKNLDDGLNQQLVELYLGKASPQGKTKIGSKDLIKIFSDPNAFFDKAYQKSNPKLKMGEWSGKTFRGINATSWAKKQGIKNKDTLWALNRAAASFNDPGQRLDMVRDGMRLARKKAAIELVRKSFGDGDNTVAITKAIDSVSNINSASELRNILVRAGVTDGTILSKIGSAFGDQLVKEKGLLSSGKIAKKDGALLRIDTKFAKGYKRKPFDFATENTDFYREIAKKYLDEKGGVLSSSTNKEDIEMAKNYAKAGLLIENWNLSDKNSKKVLSDRRKALNKLRKKIKAGASKEELRKYKKTEKQLRSDIRYLRKNRIQDEYYKYKGMWDGINSIYLKGNVAGAILDGTFFSDDNKILNPVEQHWKGVQFYDGVPILFNIAKNDKFFGISKDGKFYRKKGNFYNDTMTMVSYFTPQKLLQINGGFFAYRVYKNRMKTFEKFLELSSNQEALAKKFIDMKLFMDDGRMSFENLGFDSKYAGTMAELKKLFEDETKWKKYFGDNKEVMALFRQFQKKDGSLQKYVKIFSAGYRFKETIKNKIMAATIEKWRERIADNLIARFGSDTFLGPALQMWKLGGSIQVVMRGLAEKLLMKLGFEGFLFNTLAAGLTSGLSIIAFSLFKLLAKAAVVALIGLFMVLGLGVSYGSSLMQKYSPVSHIEPGEVLSCQGFEPEGLVNPSSNPFNSEVQPAPSNSTCPIGESYVSCTQGFIDVQGWSHQNIKNRLPVDLGYGGYIYAPQYCDTSKCTATYKGRLNCDSYAGDKVYFSDSFGNTMIMFHVAPVGAGSISSGGSWTVKGGEAFARVQTTADGIIGTNNSCWTGVHLHLEVTQNGSYVDPLEFLQSYGCNVPDETGCRDPG